MNARARYEVLRRDGFRCQACGATSHETELHVDHVRPVALGGSDAPENLQTLCALCNSGKASTSPDEPLVQARKDTLAEDRARIEANLDELEAIETRFAELWPWAINGTEAVEVRKWLRQGASWRLIERAAAITQTNFDPMYGYKKSTPFGYCIGVMTNLLHTLRETQ